MQDFLNKRQNHENKITKSRFVRSNKYQTVVMIQSQNARKFNSINGNYLGNSISADRLNPLLLNYLKKQ